jgi:hypothetical protein
MQNAGNERRATEATAVSRPKSQKSRTNHHEHPTPERKRHSKQARAVAPSGGKRLTRVAAHTKGVLPSLQANANAGKERKGLVDKFLAHPLRMILPAAQRVRLLLTLSQQ